MDALRVEDNNNNNKNNNKNNNNINYKAHQPIRIYHSPPPTNPPKPPSSLMCLQLHKDLHNHH